MSAAAQLALILAFSAATPVAAQDNSADTDEQEAQETEPATVPERPVLNLSVTVPRNESDRLIEKDCEEANDAARITNEIVVCRELGEASDGSWSKEEWEKRYAEKTKGGSTPDTFGIANHGNAIGFGKVPPPAYIVDFDALPEAPEGSDADRIARGLPPLGQNENLTEEQERARREALGLKPPKSDLGAPPK